MSTEVDDHLSPSIGGLSAPSGVTEATQAFDELRLEVLKTQQAMEDIRAALSQPIAPDYTPTLAGIVQEITRTKSVLQQLQGHPALTLTPADYQRALTQGSQVAMREAIAQLTETGDASRHTQQALIHTLGTVRARQQQAHWLAIIGSVALVTGLVLAPVLARLLPFGWDSRIAAVVMASDLWQAGARLMQAGNPDGWQQLERASALWQFNRAVIKDCQTATAPKKNPKERRCEIVIPAND